MNKGYNLSIATEYSSNAVLEFVLLFFFQNLETMLRPYNALAGLVDMIARVYLLYVSSRSWGV
jgi:hypothetical protein